MTSFDYLKNHIKSYAGISSIHGIGLFALVDIKKQEEVFKVWEGETGTYSISLGESLKLPPQVVDYILRSYSNHINNDDAVIKFRLVKDTNFLFSEPLALLNTKYSDGNIDSLSGRALRDIKLGEELFGNYENSSQIIYDNKSLI